MRLKGKRAAVLAENLYEELELWYPYHRLREEGAEVLIVGTGSSDTYSGKHGYPVRVNTTADKIKAEDFDCIVVPGGYAPDYMRRYPALLKLVGMPSTKEKWSEQFATPDGSWFHPGCSRGER